MVVLEYGESESLDWIRQNAHELAAVIVEPVQSRHPELQPFEFLRALREITADAGVAFVMDEVVTGFRVHPGGMQAVIGIRADLATYGKVIGGGLPIGILAGKAQFMDALDGGQWSYGDDSVPEVARHVLRRHLRSPSAGAGWRARRAQAPEGAGSGAAGQQIAERAADLAERLNAIFLAPRAPDEGGAIFEFPLFQPARRWAACRPAVLSPARSRHLRSGRVPAVPDRGAYRRRRRADRGGFRRQPRRDGSSWNHRRRRDGRRPPAAPAADPATRSRR